MGGQGLYTRQFTHWMIDDKYRDVQIDCQGTISPIVNPVISRNDSIYVQTCHHLQDRCDCAGAEGNAGYTLFPST